MRRAVEVMDGEYIGVFEWLCWSFLHAKKVLMMFGSHIVDLCTFAPVLFTPGRRLRSCFVIGCVVTEEALLSALQPGEPDFPTLNHYVIGVPLQQASAPVDLTANSETEAPCNPSDLGATAIWESMSEAASRGGPSLELDLSCARVQKTVFGSQNEFKKHFFNSKLVQKMLFELRRNSKECFFSFQNETINWTQTSSKKLCF